MTCIVGWLEKGMVWMGGDSLGVKTPGYGCLGRKDEKVFRNGEMLIGYTSSFRMGQLLRFSLEIPSQPEGKGDYEYMCTDFADAVIKLFEEKKFATVKDNEISGGAFLVGYRNSLYYVESDFQVGVPSLNFAAVGCGSDIALGALHALRDNLDISPKEKIIMALSAATEFSAGVRPPYTILSLDF